MGMFDWLRCEYPLPREGANALEYQTKDTEAQFLDRYEIRSDGTLWHEEYDIEDRSDPNAEGLMRIIGCMTKVNERWVRDTMTGEVEFTAYPGGKDYSDANCYSFSAYFVGGELKHLVDLMKPNVFSTNSAK